jgi:hypothetical protein
MAAYDQEDLDHARQWVGDRGFEALCAEFDPVAIIIACGIADVAELVEGYGPRNPSPPDPEDARLEQAVARAHAALGPHAPRSAEERARARAMLDEMVRAGGE